MIIIYPMYFKVYICIICTCLFWFKVLKNALKFWKNINGKECKENYIYVYITDR